MECKTEGLRNRVRPNSSWMNGVGEDQSKFGVKEWRMVIRDRELQRYTMRKTEARTELYTKDDDDSDEHWRSL